MIVVAIDPGPLQSGWVIYDAGRVLGSGVELNGSILQLLESQPRDRRLAIEMIASYGMAVGKSVFDTCVWVGRFQQVWHAPAAVRLVYRQEVKLHLCQSANAKDSNIRQALIDRYPPTGGGKTPQVGTKDKPGPLYGMSSHAWPALGVAIVADETTLTAAQTLRAAPQVDLLDRSA